MTIQSNFQPAYGQTQTFSPAVGSATITVGKGARTLRVKNTGATNVMFVKAGPSGISASGTSPTADMPVYPGEVVYLAKSPDHDTLAFISASGTTAIVTPGDGGVGSGS